MSNFIALSVVILSCILLWMPTSVAGDSCNQYSESNSTCFSNGGCECAYLTCDGVTACVAVNITSMVPLNLDRCKNFHFCFACSRGWSSYDGCASGERDDGLPGYQIALIVVGVVLLVGAIAGVIFFIVKRRRSGFTSV
eukprot:TRINITY_DN2203_c0_g1_i1.p1 TRINITY_DN2203_c0_g1~~TRINITY_DN2203_c0_g1_i1.p1  ORF type:complete len:139 (-),score=17.14 TRINITY_DN2203_c0_g1_i1:94-510(-)